MKRDTLILGVFSIGKNPAFEMYFDSTTIDSSIIHLDVQGVSEEWAL
ncbi:MAG: hypothetical protein KZQ78_15975 [Candidatus Thiodiazotropha sp. (ex Ustalcina ferruginea)]|nr:hypothetical protein [Candidatus Thiodiazotropha sp. (ex Ustalcina ferruginea)]